MLLQLLSTGFVIGQSRGEVAEVQEAAKALGIILGDCQVSEQFILSEDTVSSAYKSDAEGGYQENKLRRH